LEGDHRRAGAAEDQPDEAAGSEGEAHRPSQALQGAGGPAEQGHYTGTTGGYSTGDSPHIKAGHIEVLPHLPAT
jgi:hypothetical protein